MEIENAGTRARVSEGVPGEALAAPDVAEKSCTVAVSRRPSIMDSSRYDITETRVGEMVARVYQSPSIRGSDRRQWWYEIAWRDKWLWTELVSDPRTPRGEVEEAAVRDADRLAHVVQAVGEALADEARSAARPYRDRVEPTWTALPDQPEEPGA